MSRSLHFFKECNKTQYVCVCVCLHVHVCVCMCACVGVYSVDTLGTSGHLFLQSINMQTDWKIITVFVGGNDLCDFCKDQVRTG